jgi:Rieske [2Fe-2S] domain
MAEAKRRPSLRCRRPSAFSPKCRKGIHFAKTMPGVETTECQPYSNASNRQAEFGLQLESIPMVQPTWPELNWPAADYSRIPYGVFSDSGIYGEEQARIFHGPVWNYLALDIELPRPGDFVATYVGDTKVIVARAEDDTIHAFENSCAHRGTQIVTAVRGNTRRFVCLVPRKLIR